MSEEKKDDVISTTTMVSTSHDLKWLHQFETIECFVDGQTIEYEIEDFGDYYHGDPEVLQDIDEFLDSHGSETIDSQDLLLTDVLHPIAYTLKSGIREINDSSERVTALRKQKAVFLITFVIPRLYHHQNFCDLQEEVSNAVTGLLFLISELVAVHPPHKKDVKKMASHFQTKEFLSHIALQLWSVCLYEQGIALVPDRTLPILRKLAMLDLIDQEWNYSGSWESTLLLLEEPHGPIPRIMADKPLNDCSVILRDSRNSIRYQDRELSGLDEPDVNSSLLKGAVRDHSRNHAKVMYTYYPKCSAFTCSEIEVPDKPHRLRCYKCNYFHWCSPACQEYTEKIVEQHQPFCDDCPEECADDMRLQMQDYLNIPALNEELNEDKIKCHTCGMLKKHSKVMNRCSRCKATWYCSRECQVWDWNHGNHKGRCRSPV